MDSLALKVSFSVVMTSQFGCVDCLQAWQTKSNIHLTGWTQQQQRRCYPLICLIIWFADLFFSESSQKEDIPVWKNVHNEWYILYIPKIIDRLYFSKGGYNNGGINKWPTAICSSFSFRYCHLVKQIQQCKK